MYFQHSDRLKKAFPNLRAFVGSFSGAIDADYSQLDVQSDLLKLYPMVSEQNLGQLPAIQSWRRVYSQMGLKPTQYRCASESLLRRFKKDGSLPRLHPFVDYCNFISVRTGIPIAIFDTNKIQGGIVVGFADGVETYQDFNGANETPEIGEVIFKDEINRAHSRRWVYRQSKHSIVQKDTDSVLIVAEAHHAEAAIDLAKIQEQILDFADRVNLNSHDHHLLDSDSCCCVTFE